MRPSRLFPILPLALLASCTQDIQVAISPRANFSSIRRIAVITFSGSGGSAAADMMAQYLVAYGANVVERQQMSAILSEQHLSAEGILDPSTTKEIGRLSGADALMIGNVTEMDPNQTYVVQGGRGGVYLGGGVSQIGGTDLFPAGNIPGIPNSQILESAATVGMVARIVDVETGSILWSAVMNYEGFDTQTAMQEIASSFIDSLVPVWPDLVRPKR